MSEVAKTSKFKALLTEFDRICLEPGRPLIDAKDSLVLVGSAALATRGIRDVRDLDVLASGEMFHYLRGRSPTDVIDDQLAFQTPSGVIQVGTRMVSFGRKSGLTSFDIRRAAERWESWWVISLEHLQEFKRTVDRDKDREDLRLIDTWWPY